MAQLQLRPMGVGEILGASTTVYRRRWRTLIAIAGVLVLPYAVLYLILAETPPELSAESTPEEVLDFLSALAPWLLIRLFIVTIIFAAVIRTVLETYVGMESSWRQSAAAAISRMPALAVFTVLFCSATIVGSVMFVVPGVFLVVSLSACLPVMIIEGADPFSAVGRSWRMTSGRRWHVFGVLLAASLLVFVSSTIVYFVLGTVLFRLQGEFGLLLASEVSWIITQPFIGVTLAVLYLDLRVRKEDLDTDWLSLQLSATAFDQ